jgi:hypothetical protein
MEDKFVTKFESKGLKYICTVTSETHGLDTFFVVSYKRNDGTSEIVNLEIEMLDENDNGTPVWVLRNECAPEGENISDEFINLIGQKINFYYDLMLYGSYTKQ